MKLQILHSDEHLIAVNKPSGIHSQPLPSNPAAPSAFGYAKLTYPEIARAGPDPLEGGLLHRLDVGTSGVLLIARDRPTFERMKTLWKTEAVRKVYRAVVCGRPALPALPFLIDIPIGRSAKNASRMLPFTHPEMARRIRGKPLEARTWIESVQGQSAMPGASLTDLCLRIETGVMHQIRCHLSHLGTPILGDPRYKGMPSARLWLHAWRVEIQMSSETRPILIEAPLPPDWPMSSE